MPQSTESTASEAAPSEQVTPSDDAVGAQHDATEVLAPPATGNKKKRKGKSIVARGPTALPKNRGTGFEEYYADPPMTPQEAAEEKFEVYADDLLFEERMQSCIQRFRARRRLQGELTLFFDEYLFLGGVDTNPRPFAGVRPQDLKDLTPAQRRDATATDIIYGNPEAGERFYDGDPDRWSVDFAGVAAGFFSVRLPQLTGLEGEHVEAAVGVVENFLKYVLHHDVCVEYEDDLRAAIQVCGKAREEWPMLKALQGGLPGQFNLAAAELFSTHGSEDWSFQGFSRPEGFDARAIFYGSLALMDEPQMFARLCQGTPRVVGEHDCTLELTGVHRPAQDVVKRFKSLALNGNVAQMAPVGKATFVPATIEDGWAYPSIPFPFKEGDITLYFDDPILCQMKPGMKANLKIVELDFGLKFVKTIIKIVPSFYTFLPQELMKHYKPPRADDRPPHSIHDEGPEKRLEDGDHQG